MTKLYALCMSSLLSSISLWGADFFCNPDTQTVKAFFERGVDTKLLEAFEYRYSSEHIVFLAVHDRLEPKIYGPQICEKTQRFIQEMQTQLATKLSGVNVHNCVDIDRALWSISIHARYICNTSCALQLKALSGQELGTLRARTRVYLINPWEQVDAQKFYDRYCTNFYKNKSADELQALFEATTKS